jgi:predicted phosphoribosyltransferase
MEGFVRFADRHAAGRALAGLLTNYRNRDGVVVLALPRGGVPVAYEIAAALHAPLDVFTVRKLGVPGHEELAMGAVASGPTLVVDDELVESLGITAERFDAVVKAESAELVRREAAYRDHRARPELRGKIVVVVDDGLATGASMQAAVEALRLRGPQRIVVAVPVGAAETCARLRRFADEVICAAMPEPFYAVGIHYADFSQTSDDEVRQLLNAAAAGADPAPKGRDA